MSGAAILRIKKLTGSGIIGKAARHNKRTIQAEMGASSSIDPTRSHLNETLMGPLEEKLGSDWQRPKGMRQRTYELLMDKLADCEMRREQAFCVAAARLLGERFTDRFYG